MGSGRSVPRTGRQPGETRGLSLDVPAPALAPDALSPAPAVKPPRTLKANFAINVAGALVPLAVSLVTVPIYIRHIGDARYGVLSIVWVLLGYFGFLDLGLSRAAANALARLRDAPQEARARVLVTTLVLNLGMGLVGSLALALAGSYLLQHVLNVPEALKPEIASAFPWIVALFPLALVSGVGIGALESREEFLRANILQVVGTSLGQIVPMMLAVGAGPSLAVVIPAAATVRALTVVGILLTVWRIEGPLRARDFTRREIVALLRYGGWMSVSGTLGSMLMTIDQLIIGSIAGVASVSHYVIPMNLVLRSQIIPGAMTRTLFPRFSHHSELQAQLLAERSFVQLSLGYGAVIGPSIYLAKPFLRVWLGTAFSHDLATIAEILLLGAWVGGLGWIPVAMSNARNRPDLQGKLQIYEVVPVVFAMCLGIYLFGVVGAALVWTLRSVLDTVIMSYLTRLNLDQKGLWTVVLAFLWLIASLSLNTFMNLEILWSFLGAALSWILFAGPLYHMHSRPKSNLLFDQFLRLSTFHQ